MEAAEAFLKTIGPMHLADAPGGARYLTRAASPRCARARSVFAASARSATRASSRRRRSSDPGARKAWFEEAVRQRRLPRRTTSSPTTAATRCARSAPTSRGRWRPTRRRATSGRSSRRRPTSSCRPSAAITGLYNPRKPDEPLSVTVRAGRLLPHAVARVDVGDRAVPAQQRARHLRQGPVGRRAHGRVQRRRREAALAREAPGRAVDHRHQHAERAGGHRARQAGADAGRHAGRSDRARRPDAAARRSCATASMLNLLSDETLFRGFLRNNVAPDFVLDRGHTFGAQLTDDDKRALIAYLKRMYGRGRVSRPGRHRWRRASATGPYLCVRRSTFCVPEASMSDTIFEPLAFRHLTVKNRIFRSNVSGRFDNYDGSGNQARINWETKFARGGVGAIISSFVPVTMRGRIVPNYATIDRDERIPFWRALGQAVHEHDCRFILQLSHAGRQRDIPGIEFAQGWSSTDRDEPLHGFPCVAMTQRADRRDGCRLRRGRTARARGRARRRRAARRQRLSLHAVPQLGHQRPQGRVRRAAAEPRALPARRRRRDPRRGRHRLPPAGEDQRRGPQRRARRRREAGQHARRDGARCAGGWTRPASTRSTSRRAATSRIRAIRPATSRSTSW